jgi:hypothetical protein
MDTWTLQMNYPRIYISINRDSIQQPIVEFTQSRYMHGIIDENSFPSPFGQVIKRINKKKN